jgi:replicative DNA helicase
MEHILTDIPAERAVLAGIYSYANMGYDEVADIVNVNSFTDEIHQVIFKCLQYIVQEMQGTQVDYATYIAAANALGYATLFDSQKSVNNLKLLRAISNFPIELSNLRKLAGRIKKLEIGRNLVNALTLAQTQVQTITGDEPVDQIIALAEDPVFQLTLGLSNTQNESPQLMGDGIHEYIQHLVDNPVTQVGISTGYPYFDKAIGGGLRRKTVNLVGARMKIGKTSFGDNVGLHVAGVLGLPVLNIDTEMSYEDHRVRILANLAEVPIEDIETGRFAENSWKKDKLNKAMDKLIKIPYHYKSVAGKPFDEILAIMRRWIHRTVGLEPSGEAKPCLIIYDYFKLMDTEALQKMQEYQVLGFQFSALHNFMVRHSVPCLAFIQLNRDGITREDTDVASGSDRQLWLCSNFSILKMKSDEELAEDASANRKLVNLVNRHGPGLDYGDYINMKFQGQYNKLTEGKTRNQLKTDKSKQSEGFIVDDHKPDEQIPFK